MKDDRLLKAAEEMYRLIKHNGYSLRVPVNMCDTIGDFITKRGEWGEILEENKIDKFSKLREVKKDLKGECEYIKNLNLGKLTKEELINKIEGTRWHLEQITIAGIEKELKEE